MLLEPVRLYGQSGIFPYPPLREFRQLPGKPSRFAVGLAESVQFGPGVEGFPAASIVSVRYGERPVVVFERRQEFHVVGAIGKLDQNYLSP